MFKETADTIELEIELHEAKEQINFAWQNDEMEEMGLR